jgi:5-formyltetrahydrofolate cyclo-ligase
LVTDPVGAEEVDGAAAFDPVTSATLAARPQPVSERASLTACHNYGGGVVDAAQHKNALRSRLLARRRTLRPDELARAATCLRDVLLDDPYLATLRTVAAYVSVGSEPGTAPLLAELERRGVQTLLPRLDPDGDLTWARYTGPEGLVPAARGLLEPQAPPLGHAAVRNAGAVLVPALAVDRRGARLGRGGGSYDRVLARLAGTAVRTIALLHDGELLDLPVPTEPHDVAVQAVATPSGLVRLR